MDNPELLLTGCQSAQQVTACLWDYHTKNLLKVYRNGGAAAPKTLQLIGQDYLLTGELGKPLLHCWPVNSQEINKNIRLVLPGHTHCIAVCPRNAYLAAGIGTKLYIWQLCSGKLLSLQQKHYQPITCIQFSSDGEYVIVGGEDGLLVTYHLANLVAIQHSLLSQSKIGQIEPVYTRHDHSMPIRDIYTGTFGRHSRIATVSSDHTCRLYALQTGEKLLTLVFTELLTSVIFDNPCWQLYVGTNSGVIHQFNLKDPPRTLTHHVEKKTGQEFVGHKGKILTLGLNVTNTILGSGGEDNFAYTWDLQSKQILQKIEHKGTVTNLKFVPNFKNFFEQNLKPSVVIKNLQHGLEFGNCDFLMSLSSEEIEFSDDENCLLKEKSRRDLETENVDIRIRNYQLFRAALEISKKYKDK